MEDGSRETGARAERLPGPSNGGGRLEPIPGLARIALRAGVRTAAWSLDTSLRASSRLARAATSGESAAELIEDAGAEMRTQALRLLGLVDSEGKVAEALSDLVGDSPWRSRSGASTPTLRERGEQLLRASADVDYEQGSHPAYARILADLAPDEARILRLLAQNGPQPAVDVRSGLPFVPGSRLVAQGYTMIGAEAGCRSVDQVPAYLNNLNRLGLIWFAHEPIRDNERYQVLEVQPEVLEALKRAGRFSHIVRRSIHLTALGEDFCEVALPLQTAEIEALEEGDVSHPV